MAGTPAQGTLIFEPIPPAKLQQIRAARADEAGHRLTATILDADEDGFDVKFVRPYQAIASHSFCS